MLNNKVAVSPSVPMNCSVALWQSAGCPAMGGEREGKCATCNRAAAGESFEKWVKDTFTDFPFLFAGDIVCQACLFGFDERSELLTKKTRKEKLQRMRNYSHIVRRGEWFALSKGQKTEIYNLLLELPEVAVIAESGQKHLIFKARLGWWHFEGENLLPFPEKLKFLYEAAFKIYALGVTKAEIESGNYSQRSYLNNSIETISAMDAPLKPHRGGLQFALAIYLMQKEKEDESII